MAGLRGAMADLAETIRRVFQAPPCHAAPVACPNPQSRSMPPLEARSLQPFQPMAGLALRQELLSGRPPAAEPLGWSPRVLGEPGLQTWDAGARVSVLPTFRPEKCARLAVPALPRRAEARREVPGIPAPRSRRGWEGVAAPATRTAGVDLGLPRCFRELQLMLDLPVAVIGENLDRLSKALWMRYTLQLVRATGENIRNLEVLGIYRIPRKGTRQIRHEPATGRLRVTLGPEAVGSGRAPFILARRKTDEEIVCCFVEEP